MTKPEPIERIMRPLAIFARHKLAGASLLLAAAAAAVIWANSPWVDSYLALKRTVLSVGVGSFELKKPLLLWINDGLMSIFFFVVGLEIKREFLAGELSTRRKAMLPIAGAIGGMVVPALLYAALNWGTPAIRGWGVPMATDIAFALGILALIDAPPGLKVFLTALAIVDDIGAVIVIAVFYTENIALASLVIGGTFVLLSIGANLAGVRSSMVFFLLGLVVWLAFLKSGVHVTVAAVLMAMTIPARSRIDGSRLADEVQGLLEAFRRAGPSQRPGLLSTHEHHVLEEIGDRVDDATAPLQQLEHSLLPIVTFLVMPVFALANAGVSIEPSGGSFLGSRVAMGILLGLFVGKPLGIFLFSWIAVRAGWASLPRGVDWHRILGAGMLGGVGFTMSLFIGALAFADQDTRNIAKLGVLAASVLSGLVGAGFLALAPRARVRDAGGGQHASV